MVAASGRLLLPLAVHSGIGMSELPPVSVGELVHYFPDTSHAFARDPRGNWLWEFVNQRTGEPVDMTREGGLDRDADGSLITATNNITVRPGRPAAPWSAKIVAIYPDDTADLDIADPNGVATLHYLRVVRSEMTEPHTWTNREILHGA